MKSTNLITWIAKTPLLTPIRKRVGETILNGIRATKGVVIYLTDNKHTKEVQQIIYHVRESRKQYRMLLSESEGYQIFKAVENTNKVKGDCAEVGVFYGGSARLIARAKAKDKKLFLFDTFEGLQDVEEGLDKECFHNGLFALPEKIAKKNVEEFDKVFIKKGYFPNSAKSISNKRFSFVHLDVDTYVSTKACLEWFYPRLSKGAILISHDYINAKGVYKAFNEFFEDKPEPIIEMLTSQCCFVKM